MTIYFTFQCRKQGFGKCKRMPEVFLNSCKTALNASDTVADGEDPYTAFSEAILNFFQHYCCDDHSSSWCTHDKVRQEAIMILDCLPNIFMYAIIIIGERWETLLYKE